MAQLLNDFGEVELLDDVVDHWSSSTHVAEKGELLLALADLSRARGLRTTLLSGDVHQCAIGCVASKAGGLQVRRG